MVDVFKKFNLGENKILYDILKHSTVEERLTLCKHNKFKAMCKILDWDNDSRKNFLPGIGQSTFKIILEGFDDFSLGLQFIESVNPGFIYTNEFKAYVKDYLKIVEENAYTSFILGDREYRKYKNGDEEWYKDGKLHRDNDLPAIIEIFDNGKLFHEAWYMNGKRHRKYNHASVFYYHHSNGKKYESWWKNGELHREDGPAYIEYFENGQVEKESWWLNGVKIKSISS